jgi:septal ring-binding cell division protein DamX
MPALTFGHIAASVLLASLPLLSPLLAQAAEAGGAKADGEWNCAQAPDTGKWACSRDGVSATELSTTKPSATEPSTTESSTTKPLELDPYEAQARAAVEGNDGHTPEPAQEPVAAAPAEPAPTELVDEPVEPAAAPVVATEPGPIRLPASAPEPEPVAETMPEPAPAAVDTSNLPDYQRLAYVPEKPTSLLELPPHFWVVQLMAVSSKEFLESYAAEHNLRGLSAARIASGERLFFVLILGIYETRDRAEQAKSNMPPPYDKYNSRALLRTLGSLQDAMRKADQMTGSSDF